MAAFRFLNLIENQNLDEVRFSDSRAHPTLFVLSDEEKREREEKERLSQNSNNNPQPSPTPSMGLPSSHVPYIGIQSSKIKMHYKKEEEINMKNRDPLELFMFKVENVKRLMQAIANSTPDHATKDLIVSQIEKLLKTSIYAESKERGVTMGDFDRIVAQLFVEIGSAAVPELIEELKHFELPNIAILALSKIKDPSVIPLVINSAPSTVFEARNAILVLARLKRFDTIPDILENMKDISFEKHLREFLTFCETKEEVNEFESRVRDCFSKLLTRGQVSNKTKMDIANLMNEIAKKRNELCKDKGILLDDKPKKPKGNRVYQQLRRVRHA
jgi:hypothetical protein